MDFQSGMSYEPTGISRRGMLRWTSAGILAGCAGGRVTADDTAPHPLVAAIRVARQSLGRIGAVSGYSCVFAKKEVVDDHLIEQTMTLKVRHKPFSVYMYFREPKAGREVIFVEGQNENRLLVHETGLASLIGTLALAPEDPRVRAENRHPITKAGIVRTLETQIAIWEGERKYGETEVRYFEDAKLGEMVCRVVESSHPQPRKQFAFQTTRLWIDVKTGYPVRLQQYAFPKKPGSKGPSGKGPLVEDYSFTELKTDVELTDRDFDVENPAYNY